MKKVIIAAVITLCNFSTVKADDLFNHIGVGLGVGTNGISIEAATPVTRFLQMRAGISVMPKFTFKTDADYTAFNTNPSYGEYPDYGDYEIYRSMPVTVDIGRVQGQLIFNFYPIPKAGLFIAAGAYFAGNKLVKVKGSSNDLEDFNKNDVEDPYITIGDYQIPVDKDGNVSGGFKVNGFRPYLGIGFGKVVPKSLVNFCFELGVQFQGKPQAYTDYGTIDTSFMDDDGTISKIQNALKVYPTLTFRLNFRVK